MNRCFYCDCWDHDREGCTMPETEMWYACPIEAEKPENRRALAEWVKEVRKEMVLEQRTRLTHDRLVELITKSNEAWACPEADGNVCTVDCHCSTCSEVIANDYEECIRKDEREKIIANIKTHFTTM